MGTGGMQPLPEPEEGAVEWSAEFIVVDAQLPVVVFHKIFALSSVTWFVIRWLDARPARHLFYVYKRSELEHALKDPASESLQDALTLNEAGASSLLREKKIFPKHFLAEDFAYPSRRRVVALDRDGDPRLVGEARATEPTNHQTLDYTIVGRPQDAASALPPTQPLSKDKRVIVRIFYATDRKRVDGASAVSYLDERSTGETLELGTCYIAIPRNHLQGQVERKTWWKLLLHWKDSYFDLVATTPSVNDGEFYAQVKAYAAESAANDLFVFIHGFNVSFADGAIRTAQLAYDLGFHGAPLMYSWPSGGSVLNYLGDEESVNWSMPHLKAFLRDLKKRAGVGKISLIAHSMGNRAMVRCLKELALEGGNNDLGLQQIIMAAPDLDSGEFRQIAKKINNTDARITLYTSSEDKALQISQTFHSGYPRAGEAGENMIVVQGVDTIDASAVDTSFMKHSYFGKKTVVSDIFYLITRGLAPKNRYGLLAKPHVNGEYWEFQA